MVPLFIINFIFYDHLVLTFIAFSRVVTLLNADEECKEITISYLIYSSMFLHLLAAVFSKIYEKYYRYQENIKHYIILIFVILLVLSCYFIEFQLKEKLESFDKFTCKIIINDMYLFHIFAKIMYCFIFLCLCLNCTQNIEVENDIESHPSYRAHISVNVDPVTNEEPLNLRTIDKKTSYQKIKTSIEESLCLTPPDSCCSICIDEENKDVYIILPCNHTFHLLCINDWLKTLLEKDLDPICPLCRANLINNVHSTR